MARVLLAVVAGLELAALIPALAGDTVSIIRKENQHQKVLDVEEGANAKKPVANRKMRTVINAEGLVRMESEDPEFDEEWDRAEIPSLVQ